MVSRKPRPAPIGISIKNEGERAVLVPTGDWTTDNLGKMDKRLRAMEAQLDGMPVAFDVCALGRIDLAGAFVLGRTVRSCSHPHMEFNFIGEHRVAQKLMAEADAHSEVCPDPPAPYNLGQLILIRSGRAVMQALNEGAETAAFFGQLMVTFWRVITNPRRIRFNAIVNVAEEAGVNALPIIALLAFFIGAVVAFLGANLLERFGAALFTVDLVALAVLREFGVMMMALILAGRSNSAFTAHIGAMKMRQEIDAMQVLGMDTFEVLVLPRVIACIIMAPILAFAAIIAGLVGGGLVTWAVLDVSPTLFVARMQENVPLIHFWVGIAKAPVFALAISLIGCRQGLLVEGNVQSLGERTTASVVQALFTVIFIDAVFAMIYLELDW
ncbi:MAG: ABC transporter permease [Robiginitomaculum sp.]|nr:MAG: ABC transporter permease [Robiginitomaculum sp.]